MMGSTTFFASLAIIFVCASPGLCHPKNQENEIQTSKYAIVGGHNVSIEDYPYQVLLVFKDMPICGGSIISENYIVTAGHCLRGGITAADLKIRVGSSWINKDYTSISIAEAIAHPDSVRLEKDVAVLKTSTPIQFTKSIKPIKLAPKGRIAEDGSIISVSGWGHQHSMDQNMSECLMAVEVPVVNHELCKTVYDLTENMLCAGYFETGGKDSCQGDSGGPAVQDNLLVGIVSFGKGCAEPKHPGVYTNVAAPAVRDFITKHTGL